MSRLLEYDPISRTWETFDYAHDTGNVTIGYWQDIEPIIEANKARKLNIDKNKCQDKRDLLHYARVPIVAQYDMLFRHGVRFGDPNHRKKVMQLLNSPEYEYCRISHWKHDR